MDRVDKNTDISKVEFTHDPKVVGPGTWFSLHVLSWNCQTEDQNKHFCLQIRQVINDFPCGDCRKDAQKYLEDIPPETYLTYTAPFTKRNIGMFAYVVDFHNYVNKKLGKTLIPLQDAFNSFMNDNIGYCTAGCAEESKKEDIVNEPKLTLKQMMRRKK